MKGLLGDNRPPLFPLTLEREMEMVVEESVHNVAGVPGRRTTKGDSASTGRIGADNRTFAVSVYHQEHCLLYLHRQLTNRTRKHRFPHHQYCLSRCATPT